MNQKDKIILIVGDKNDIEPSVKYFLKRGARVVIASKDPQQAQTLIKYDQTYQANIDHLNIDLNDLDSIKVFLDQFAEKYKNINTIIYKPNYVYYEGVSPQGLNKNFQNYYLGPFYLFHNLIPLMNLSFESRIILTGDFDHFFSIVPKLIKRFKFYEQFQNEYKSFQTCNNILSDQLKLSLRKIKNRISLQKIHCFTPVTIEKSQEKNSFKNYKWIQRFSNYHINLHTMRQACVERVLLYDQQKLEDYWESYDMLNEINYNQQKTLDQTMEILKSKGYKIKLPMI